MLTVASLGFMWPNYNFRGFRIQGTEILFLTAATAFAIEFARQRVRLDRSAFYLILVLYLASLTASALFSLSPSFSILKLSGEAYLVGLAIIFAGATRCLGTIKLLVLVWIATGTLVSLIGVFAIAGFYVAPDSFLVSPFLHHYGSLIPGPYPRIQSTFFYPAMLCSYLTVSFVLVLTALRARLISSGVSTFALFVHAVAIAFTITPGIGGALLGLGLWFAIRFRDSRPRLAYMSAALGILAAITFVAAASFSFRPTETSPYFFTFIGERIDPSLRLLAWQDSFQTFVDYPIFGKGLGLGVCYVPFVSPSGTRHLFTDAHQTWLNIAGQAGIFGVLSFSLLCGWVIKVTLPWRQNEDLRSILRVGFGVAFVAGFLVQGLVGSLENARHLWVLIGITAGLHYLADTEES